MLLLNGCGKSVNQVVEIKPAHESHSRVDPIFLLENFRRDVEYQPISLRYKGKSILIPGQKVEDIHSSLSFRYDPNGDFWNKSSLIKDHLSLDDDLSIELEKGSINGIFFFSSDQKENRVFNISGNWTIRTQLTEDNEVEIIEQITKKLFPILKNKLKFEKNWKYESKNKNYIEHFLINPPKEEGSYWTMNYKVQMI